MRGRQLPPIVYSLAACVFTWPLVLQMGSRLGASDATGDPALNLWTLGWDLHALTAHPSWLLSGRIFDAGIFFPARHALAFSDHLLLQAMVLWPVYLVTGHLVFCYNLLLVASLVASAWAMHALVRQTVGHEPAAYVGGLIFGFAPYHFTHLIHLQLQSLYWLPLTLLFIHRLRAGNRWSDAVGLGMAAGLQLVSSVYYGVIGGVGLAAAAFVLAIAPGPKRRGQFVIHGAVAIAIALTIALPVSLSYVRVARESGAGRNLYEASHGSAVLASYVQAPVTNALYGRTGWLRPGPGQRLPRKDGPEQGLFPGFCALILAGFALLAASRDMRVAVRVYAVIGVIGVLLSLGPDGIRPFYSTLYNTLFGMQAIRAPARFGVLALCAIAVLAAVAVRDLDERMRRPTPIVAATALAIITLECFNGAIAYPAAPALTTPAGIWLKAHPGSGAVVCVPMEFDTANTPCMLQSLEHGRPVVNGYSGVTPPFFGALVDVVKRMPSAESLKSLHDLGVEYIVSEHALAVESSLSDALVERARFDEARIYQLVWSPAIDEAVSARTDAPPPDPGPVPFGVGEQITYRVNWTSGPLGVPAGEATMSVVAADADGHFRFVVAGRTASWVSRFFEADATMVTTTDTRLLPLTLDATIVEGGRRVERRLVFDAGAHSMRMAIGDGESIAFPLAANARDPVSLLFYLRTLPLSPTLRVALPLTDNGRQTRVDVTVGAEESLTLAGRTWSAWKVEPRLRESVERRAARAMVAWISADAQRVPLVLQIEADFGVVRAELSNYRAR